jgi:hypothetical protein
MALKKFSGTGDVEMASWAIVGFAALNFFWSIIWLGWFLVIYAIYAVSMRLAKVEKLPGTPMFLAAFILTAVSGWFLDMVVFGVI